MSSPAAETNGHSLPPIQNTSPQSRTITKEQLAQLTHRIYNESLTHKTDKLKTLESKIYVEADRRVISKAEVEKSVARQVTDEMTRRRENLKKLEAKYHPPEPCKKMTAAEIEEATKRIYEESVRKKQETIAKADETLTFRNKSVGKKRLPPITPGSEVEQRFAALSKPKKRDLTEEEINAILGFK